MFENEFGAWYIPKDGGKWNEGCWLGVSVYFAEVWGVGVGILKMIKLLSSSVLK